MSDSGKTKEYYQQLKKRTMLTFKNIQGTDNKDEIAAIDNFILNLFKPKEYSGSNGAEIKAIKGFEEMCLVVSQYTVKDPKKLTVLEFYQAIEYIKKQHKAQEKASKKLKKR